MSVNEALTQLRSSNDGLSAAEAGKRFLADGPNELKEGKRISAWSILFGQFKSLIIWILIAAGVIVWILGEEVEALAIMVIVMLNAIIGFYQELSAERSIAALKLMIASMTRLRFEAPTSASRWGNQAPRSRARRRI